jgi:4-hydroxybenzoate polyprenyltransferase
MPAVGKMALAAQPEPRSLARLLSCIRIDEVLVLQGTPFFGALFSMGALTKAKCLDLVVLAVASCCLVAHVFVLNDLSGSSTDVRDPNRSTQVFTVRGIGRREAGALCAALLVVSLLLLIPFGLTPLFLAFALAIVSALYSFTLKGVPMVSSLLHLTGGLFHFLLGYSLFHALDWRGLEIGSFFALTFVAGHLTHEARDCASDLPNGIRTNAVRFGRVRTFFAGFLLFTAADVLLIVLAMRGIVPRALVMIGALYPLHVYWTLQTFSTGLTFENIRRLQMRYRILYAIIGLMIVLTVSL